MKPYFYFDLFFQNIFDFVYRENFVKIILALLWQHYVMWVMQLKVINEDEEVVLKVNIYIRKKCNKYFISHLAETNVFKIVKMIMERNLAPVIVFSFSKKDCESYACAIAKLDFNSGLFRKQNPPFFFHLAIILSLQMMKNVLLKKYLTMPLISYRMKIKNYHKSIRFYHY